MTLPDYETLEGAYKVVGETVKRLPESTERRRVEHHLEIAEKLTYEARDRAKAEE